MFHPLLRGTLPRGPLLFSTTQLPPVDGAPPSRDQRAAFWALRVARRGLFGGGNQRGGSVKGATDWALSQGIKVEGT